MFYNLKNRSNYMLFNFNKVVRNYRTISLNEDIPRHFPPGNKEWKNSVYTYNKDYIKGTSIKDKMVSNAIKSYLNIVPIPKKITKSQRMRNLIRRSTTKKLFVSKPEIKQNNDKTIITVYTFDRENQLWTRRLHFFYKWLYKREQNSYLSNRSFSLRRKILKLKEIKRKFKTKKVNKYLSRRRFFRRRNFLKRKEMKRFRLKTKSLLNTMFNTIFFNSWKKYILLKVIYMFSFLLWALSLFNIKASMPNPNLIRKETTIEVKGEKKTIVYYVEKYRKKNFRVKLILNCNGINSVFDLKRFSKGFISSDFVRANIILLRYLIVNITSILDKASSHYNYINLLFKSFRISNRKKFFERLYLKELLTVKYLSKIYVNKFKFSKFIPGLKQLLNRLYNKKIELNIVNLKYLHLNSSNLTEALTIKLKKKTGRLLRVLRKSLKLVRLPRKFSARLENKNITSSNKSDIKRNDKGILNSLKYKWISGIRLEAKGRLTRRYTASRSVFKYKYKGNLRNLDNLYSREYKAKSPSVFMMRGQFRPNLEHSFAYSKKRIGAFGLKTWLSGV